MTIKNGTSSVMQVTPSGNVGIGVTPSAWSQGKAIGIGSLGCNIWGAAPNQTIITANSYYNGGWKYAANGTATNYKQASGSHFWYTASNNTLGAGAAATFTQAMTLDASGNLLVGTTSNPNTARAYFRYDTLATQPVINSASIVAAATTWNHFVGQSGNGSTVTTNNIFIRGNGDIVNANGI